jgi:hypothetical protein
MLKLFAEYKKGAWAFHPGRTFSSLFLILFALGLIAKWFLGFSSVETADLGVLVVPILGLIANLAKDSVLGLRKTEDPQATAQIPPEASAPP